MIVALKWCRNVVWQHTSTHMWIRRMFSLVCSADDAATIFRDAAALNLTGEGHVWIVTEQVLETHNIPLGALGLRQIHVDNEEAHIRDSL